MISLKNKKLNEIKNKQILEKINKQIKEQIKERKDKIEKHNSNVKILNAYNRLNIHYQLNPTYNSIIPLHLYTCHLYDEEDCRTFIKHNFEPDVLDAYNSLIPCSYKSDLWRFCVLYINGGIYMDIKFKCVNNFKFIALTEKEHFVRDRPENSAYTALIVTLPQNTIMRKCIYQIVENVKKKYYGNNPLYPTGPNLLGKYFTKEELHSMKMYFKDSFIENKLNKFYIVKGDRIILTYYDGYREEQSKTQKLKHYSQLWNDKNIYN